MVKQILIFALRKPLMAFLALLVFAGGAMALVGIIGSGASNDGANVPIIQAESRAFKIVPEDRGGMEIANEDTTVFNTLRAPNNFSVVASAETNSAKGQVENLLGGSSRNSAAPADSAAANQQAREKLAAFSESVEKIIEKQPAEGASADLSEVKVMAQSEADKATDIAKVAIAPQSKTQVKDITESLAAIKPAAGSAKVEQTRQQLAALPKPMEKPVNSSAPYSAKNNTAPAPNTIGSAGSSPETLAFVRSVLDSESKEPLAAHEAAKAMALIEPAAGAATTTSTVTQGSGYFVQLASVTSEAAAHKAWPKYQKDHSSALSQVDYRVQEADRKSVV